MHTAKRCGKFLRMVTELKKGDFIWGVILLAFIGFVVYPSTHLIFVKATTAHPFIGGFLKFALLATMGEMLVVRLNKGKWLRAPGFIWRVIMWGFLGMVITLIFQIFGSGVQFVFEKGYLPGKDMKWLIALVTSMAMNLTFAPTFMAFHRFTDSYLDLKYGEGVSRPTVVQVMSRIDWNAFVTFVLMKTVVFFWIPAHTITFLLPGEYRVLAAAMLSLVLGLLLTMGKRKK